MTTPTEGGHFYLSDGTPFYTVPNKSRPGEVRPATVRDALKAVAEPSVSTVLKAAAAPGLVRYFVNSALDSALTLPRLPGESLDAFKARALLDSQEQAKRARDRGTELHTAIERHLSCQPFDSQFGPHVANVESALADKGINIREGRSERSFCLPGQYAGKVDLHGEGWVLDFKGVDDAKIGGRLGYPEHVRQLSAYANGLGMPDARLLNVFIGRTDGAVVVREWAPEDAVDALAEFLALLRFYRLVNGFPVDATESTMTTAQHSATAVGQTETSSSLEAA